MQVTVRIQLTVDTQICLWMGNSQRGNDKQYETNQQIRYLARLYAGNRTRSTWKD